jgi:hypothetical protein
MLAPGIRRSRACAGSSGSRRDGAPSDADARVMQIATLCRRCVVTVDLVAPLSRAAAPMGDASAAIA